MTMGSKGEYPLSQSSQWTTNFFPFSGLLGLLGLLGPLLPIPSRASFQVFSILGKVRVIAREAAV